MNPWGIYWRVAAAGLGLALLANSCAQPRPKTVVAPPAPVRPRSAPPPPRARLPQPGELRGVWVSDTAHLDWDRATASLQRAGFNALYVNLVSAGGAFYPHSRVLPDLSGTATDTVTRGIELAHQRGLAVHAKLITLFMFKAPAEFQHRLTSAGRVMLGIDRKPALQNGDPWLCPSQPANRALLTDAITELLARYPVDGLQFDYIRFYEEPTCFCRHCRAAFETSLGQHLSRWPAAVTDGPYTAQFHLWRRTVINDWMRELTTRARAQRPGLTISAAVFHDLERGREDRAQDWQLWLARGYVDYVCPMNYAPDPREFAARLRRQQLWADPRRIVTGIGSWKLEQMPQLLAQINAARHLGAPGFILFSYDDAAARNFLPALGRQPASSRPPG